MPAGIEKFAAVSIVLAPACIFLAYAWSRTSQTITQHQILTGISAGVGSIFIALLLAIPSLFLAIGQGPLGTALVGAFPGSGINEELAKALICAHLIFRAKAFEEPGEILLLCMLVGFGFALYENVGYLSGSKDAIGLAYLRALTATMMHMSLAVLMGAAAVHVSRTGNFTPFVATIAGQMVLHAAYNFPLLYASALAKAGDGFSPGIITANSVVLILCVVLAVVALNVTDLRSERSSDRDYYEPLVVAGGIVLVIFSVVTAAVLNVVPFENRYVRLAPLHSYRAFCGPPLVLGLEMILSTWRKPSRKPGHPAAHFYAPPAPRRSRTIQPTTFGRRQAR